MLDVGCVEFYDNANPIINNELIGGVLLQFTGLKDKNGKEIYEGDIIIIHANKRRPEYIGQVVYTEKDTLFEIAIGKNDWMPIETTNEVIGNIYETPELLI